MAGGISALDHEGSQCYVISTYLSSDDSRHRRDVETEQTTSNDGDGGNGVDISCLIHRWSIPKGEAIPGIDSELWNRSYGAKEVPKVGREAQYIQARGKSNSLFDAFRSELKT